MLIAQSTIKPLHLFFPPHLLSTTGAHPCYKQCCSEEGSYSEVLWRCVGARRTQPPVDCLWRFGVFVSRIKRKSLIIFLFLSWYCFCIHLYVTMCMKLDPGMHIGLHLVFFGKTGVTAHLATPSSGAAAAALFLFDTSLADAPPRAWVLLCLPAATLRWIPIQQNYTHNGYRWGPGGPGGYRRVGTHAVGDKRKRRKGERFF
jgi:hypothetical protein